MWKLLAIAALAVFLGGSAYAGNVSQDTVDAKNMSVTLSQSNTWTLIAARDPQRQAMVCQAVGANNMGLFISAYSAGSSTPVPTGIGSAGVIVLLPYGSYQPSGGWIFGGAVWVIGTSGDAMTCYFSATQP